MWPDPDPQKQKPIVIIKEFPPPPTTKTVRINLMWGMINEAFQVTSISNMMFYQPGQWLHKDVVAKLCELPNWDVIIIGDQLINQILGIFGGAVSTVVNARV